jgi:N-acetylmuramoyl-L-alanine amidase
MRGIGRILAVLLLCLSLPAAARADPAVRDVRLGLHPDKTRLVLELSEAPRYRTFLVQNPDRLVVELAGGAWRLEAPSLPEGRGIVTGVRFAHFNASTSRLVADLGGPVRLDEPILLAGGGTFRLAIDLTPIAGTMTAATPPPSPPAAPASLGTVAGAVPVPQPKPAAEWQAPQPEPLMQVVALGFPPPAKPAPPLGIPLIVIDAGHGGVDPGAIGAGGSYEKNITLSMARELKKVLEATGRYRVVLTRSEDVFIPLRERIAITRRAGGDLFLSLHADAHANAATRGASVYTLSETASDAEAEALAQRENKVDLIAGVDLSNESEVVTGILIDLAQRETMNLSARFAGLLVDELARSTLLLRNTHRFAGFAVLKAPDVPSVLVEMGYLSNASDESLFNTKAYRRKLADAIRRGIDGYFEWQTSLKLP